MLLNKSNSNIQLYKFTCFKKILTDATLHYFQMYQVRQKHLSKAFWPRNSFSSTLGLFTLHVWQNRAMISISNEILISLIVFIWMRCSNTIFTQWPHTYTKIHLESTFEILMTPCQIKGHSALTWNNSCGIFHLWSVRRKGLYFKMTLWKYIPPPCPPPQISGLFFVINVKHCFILYSYGSTALILDVVFI